MRIERLILQGFKSFGERTCLEFGPGIHGIVGPNGSGKSNLVEALRWVVGARARELRGEEALSLLFHGAEGRAPSGFAEVSLELGGERRVALSRRLERDGHSEVRISGRPGTLRQVEQVLWGTGLTRGGYAVVGQGEVGQILQAGPEVLLGYLEEAAGLRAVAQASQAARERLGQAALERAQRSQELEEQKALLAEKARQAEAAQRAEALAARVLLLRRSLLAARIREAEREAEAAAHRSRELRAEQEAIRERLRSLEAAKQKAQEAQEAAQAALAEALRQAEGLVAELRLVEQEQAALGHLLKRIAREQAEAQAQRTRLQGLQPPQPPQAPEPDPARLQEDERRLDELRRSILAEERRLEAGRQAYERYLQARAAYQARQQAYEEEQARRAALEEERARLEALLLAHQERLEHLRQREKALRSGLEEHRQKERRLRSEAQAALAEARRLEALLRSGSDLAEGPRQVRAAGIPGLIGVVADLLQVPAGLELALEVALGARMQWVLTEDEKAAKAAIELLKRRGGRATFLPRTLLKPPRERSSSLAHFPGVVGVAREQVALPACPEALPVLLGDTLLLENLEAALALARLNPQHPRLVTLEGELLESSGALTGGRVQRGGQMLALRRRCQEAQAEAQRLEAEAQRLEAACRALQDELVGLGLAELVRQEAELLSELKAVQSSLVRLEPAPPPQAPEAVAAPDPTPLQALRQEYEALHLQAAQQRELVLAWQRYHEDVERYAQAQREQRRIEARLAELGQEEAGLLQRLAELEERRASLQEARAALDLGPLEQKLQAARQQSRRLAEEETRLLARMNQVLADLEALHLTQARREAAVETLQQELSTLPPGPVEEGQPRSLARALAEAEAALAALGPVNHLAQAEYARLKEEVERLEAALKEAEAVVQRLEGELREIESAYRERLEEAYTRFKERFAHYARALLDAEAGLERSPRGLELVLRPAGKRTVSLNLLSMGERTMGALAFLFALSEIGEGRGGLPIAVLDEVDAPLDEANIERFCRFLKQFKGQTQFILVTHQKRTMEACDALYGVTAERGVSRVYSIKQEEWVG
ncbi:chromosome segregation protein SMC [Meiothermus sp. QL-1]|uniref:AAA family ATPase n=1 Tax=Meiothermus sp. QL-1 TaxID=2058095 RepID=UPI000E0A7E8F|nr:AAA family ATPase [Meiothermus sp. QL-1]RDI94512.1 chromosome segregation protein SMC [Meiothermus sp. QL-1]